MVEGKKRQRLEMGKKEEGVDFRFTRAQLEPRRRLSKAGFET